jgi:D-alanyl-D-alanine carboxypeptidase (penicillin-binding protein 5/6)
MRNLALMAAFVLQTAGLWHHLPTTAQAQLAKTAVAPPAPIAKHAPLPKSAWAMPLRVGEQPLRFDAATSVLALDRVTATPLYSQNATKQRPIASVTKLVTALVILSRHDPAATVTVPTLPAYGPEDDRLGLVAGEAYRWGDLVKAALIPSANDAADAMALADSGSQAKFAAQMNLKLKDWGINSARFTNPSGLQDTGNYATAQSLAQIALLALENPFLRDAAAQTNLSITSSQGRTLTAATTNKLLASGQFYGIKTGYTLAAGECFVGLTRIQGHDVITVVLGSADRFGDTQTLTNWIGHNYQWL